MGLKRLPDRRSFRLDADLHVALLDLAEKERRPAQEIQAELLRHAQEQRKTGVGLRRNWKSISPREEQVTALVCQ